MRKILIILILAVLIVPYSNAQKVGLVLSGGGAKGLTHIGIIRALEENNIPIDYITGTSMGAIIGALYAMGYSPDDMERLISSEDFKRWYSGAVEEEYVYYFKKNAPTPEFFNIKMSLKDSLSTVKPQFLPSSMVNPIQMNLVFVDLFARATALCGGNFDNLFIPFRCVASDVYNKKQLVMKKGDLGDAVRASMSFPFVFKPIQIDGVLAYDGGIYNNFPTDVMRDDFHPDIIIGSVVAANPTKPDENDLMSQIDNMVMQKTDYSIPDSVGIVMKFKYDNVGLLDFDRIKEIQDIGYNRTISIMDSIKSRIHRRVNADNIRLRRLVFKSNLPELIFKNIEIQGANALQKSYIKKEFHYSENKVFTYEDLKRGYFRLLSDNTISEIIPHAIFNPIDDTYNLNLKVKMEDNFSIRMGGNISSTNSNQVYFGLSYKDLNYYSKELILDGQLGKVYNNFQFTAKVDFPTQIPTSYRLIASISTFDYYKNDKLFSGNDNPAFNKKDERFVKIKAAVPFLSKKKAEFGLGYAHINDQYFQTNIIDFGSSKHDRSNYRLVGGSIGFGGSTLNAKQFATEGSKDLLLAQVFSGNETYTPGTTTSENTDYKNDNSWMQISYKNETYYKISPKFTLGSYIEALYSSKNFSENYTATILEAGEFAPTSHSQISYNEAFRANQYLALGVKPIYNISSVFHLRGEVYGFQPIKPIERSSINKALYGKSFSKFEYLGEISLVCRLPFGAISAYVNHYSSPSKNWNVGVSLGWLLFNSRFIE
ncbi:MAG: patatin [Bacteroidetes bacterium]|nr:patatin [Bacteroidota bacterium]